MNDAFSTGNEVYGDSKLVYYTCELGMSIGYIQK